MFTIYCHSPGGDAGAALSDTASCTTYCVIGITEAKLYLSRLRLPITGGHGTAQSCQSLTSVTDARDGSCALGASRYFSDDTYLAG